MTRPVPCAVHASEEAKIREEICVTGASLYTRGYTVGSAGNISARLEDGWLITPTDACLGRLDPAQIAKVDLADVTSEPAAQFTCDTVRLLSSDP